MDKIPVTKAFKFAFEPKDWVRRVGVYLTIFVGAQLLYFFVQFFSGGIANTFTTYSEQDPRYFSFMLLFLGTYAFFYVVILLPAIIYTYGYSLETFTNIVKGRTPLTPLHTDIGKRFKLGAINVFCLNLLPWLATTIIISLEVFALVAVSSALRAGGNELTVISAVGGTIGVIFLALLALMEILFIGAIYLPTSIYLYVKTDSILAAINPANVIKVLVKHGKSIFKAGLVVILICIAVVIASFFTLFCVVLIGPLLQAYMYLVNDYIYGSVFKEIYETDKV